ncbi:MAG: alpha/beta fold hydrolase [Candidatus Lokiarchaeota archaeon]|nr:alpha/beta fold hydrolase [Candidatus Lokiarchaeota archaeon]
MPQEHMTFNEIDTYIKYDNLEEIEWESIKEIPSKVPFVIQHGHTANHNFVKPIYDFFNEKGWPVVSFDWRGHGWSQKKLVKPYTLNDCVEDLYAVYNDFLLGKYGYEKFNLLGHSMGGFISLKYALKYQNTLNKLIPLSTSASIVGNFFTRMIMSIYIWYIEHNYNKMMQKKKEGHKELGLDNFPHWTDTSLMPDPKATIEFLKDFRYYNIKSELHKINIPTLVCIGSEDSFVSHAKVIAKKIPNAELRIMDGYVHNIPIDAKDKLSENLYRFLNQKK